MYELADDNAQKTDYSLTTAKMFNIIIVVC